MILPPKRATLRRYLRLANTRYSLLRSLEYERIEGLTLRGRTLDVGGGTKNSYYHLLRIEGSIESVNIDPKIQPTMIADLNKPLPIASESYDNIISLNTFEHIENDTLAVAESIRVLKRGGSFHIIVPFMYRLHGSPSDFHRHTSYWWESYLSSLGVDRDALTVEPLLWSPVSSAFSLVEFNGLRGLRKKAVMLRTVLSHARWPGRERLPAGYASDVYSEFALGYYIHGTR